MPFRFYVCVLPYLSCYQPAKHTYRDTGGNTCWGTGTSFSQLPVCSVCKIIAHHQFVECVIDLFLNVLLTVTIMTAHSVMRNEHNATTKSTVKRKQLITSSAYLRRRRIQVARAVNVNVSLGPLFHGFSPIFQKLKVVHWTGSSRTYFKSIKIVNDYYSRYLFQFLVSTTQFTRFNKVESVSNFSLIYPEIKAEPICREKERCCLKY